MPFGVEVTEFYDTESDARARNHPTYVSDLLAGGGHMHKDDVSVLSVARVSIQGPDGVVKQTDVSAILRELPTYDDKAKQLAAAIAKKDEDVATYEPAMSHACGPHSSSARIDRPASSAVGPYSGRDRART